MSRVVEAVAAAATAPAGVNIARGAFKPGQSKPTPSPGSGERVFYSSLWDEKVRASSSPVLLSVFCTDLAAESQGVKSDIAVVWMIENGCFSDEQLARHYPAAFVASRDRLKARASSAKH